MSKVIALSNQKGGVGKTTTTVNLGACLADNGKKVLIIDMDAQGNASSGLGIQREKLERDMYDCIIEGYPLQNIICQTSHENLWIAPSTVQLAGAEVELATRTGREECLKKIIQPQIMQYDYILIDCPPSLGHLTINAFTASDTILIPVQCEYYALEGLSQLLNTIRLVQRHFHPALHIEGVLLTMYDARTNLGNEVTAEVRKYFKDSVFKTVIPRNVRLSEAPSHGLAIIDYDKRSKGAQAYQELALEVLDRDAK